MHLLKEPIDSLTLSVNYSKAYDALHSKLIEMHCDIKQHDKDRGEIVINGVWKVFDMVVWHCWADKILFQVKVLGENKTVVDIFGLPNIFKIKAKKEDKLIDVSKVITQLRQLDIGEE
jgi:hypothetical protein